MIGFLIFLIMLPGMWWLTSNPAPDLVTSKTRARNITCEQLDARQARQRLPGVTSEATARGSFGEPGPTWHCTPRMIALGERPLRDEFLLDHLRQQAEDIAQKALARDDAAGTTFLVDASYPDAKLATKIAFAVKTALIERRGSVSDRVPLLAAGDVLVLGTMPFSQAAPLACSRLSAENALAAHEALLLIAPLDPRDVGLRAGRCMAGMWQWLY